LRIRLVTDGPGAFPRITNPETGETLDHVLELSLNPITGDSLCLTGRMEVAIESVDIEAEVDVAPVVRAVAVLEGNEVIPPGVPKITLRRPKAPEGFVHLNEYRSPELDEWYFYDDDGPVMANIVRGGRPGWILRRA